MYSIALDGQSNVWRSFSTPDQRWTNLFKAEAHRTFHKHILEGKRATSAICKCLEALSPPEAIDQWRCGTACT